MNYSAGKNPLVKFGDTCVIYISNSLRYILKIDSESQVQTKFGILRGADLVDHSYGLRYECAKGWIVPLRLTTEQWTQLLPHRTQILYQADISMILLQLDIKPGSVVIESGTGSGSLSHAILRACVPHGHLYTFDINESRVKDAQKEFDDHGFGKNCKVTLRNVCEAGFGEELVGKADACMLDIPQTWSAIEHAYKVLKPDGSRLCAFSPCVEQVQQNVAKMRELKLKDIVTMECLLRPFEVRSKELRMWNEDILDGLVAIDLERFRNLRENLNPTKKTKLADQKNSTVEFNIPKSTTDLELEDDKGDLHLLKEALTNPKAQFNPTILPKRSHSHAKQFNETVSHSGFLTFATRRP